MPTLFEDENIFDAGDYETGQRVTAYREGDEDLGPIEARIVRIETMPEAERIARPISIWFSDWPKPSGMEARGGFGYPVSASEIVEVKK